MTRKELQELGYTDEQVNQIMDLNGKAINAIKAERDDAIAKYTSSQEELTKREADFAELQKDSTASKELQEKFTNLNSEYEQYKAEATEREKQIKFNSALGLAIAKVGTVDEVSFKANLDLTNIELTEEGLKGFDEQATALKESKKFLFGETLDGVLTPKTPVKPLGKNEEFNNAVRKAAGKL